MSDEPKDMPMEVGDNVGALLENFINRIEILEEEKVALLADIKAIYETAQGEGIDKKELKQLIKDRKADTEKTVDFRTRVELLRRALANRQGELGDWARSYRSRAAKYKLDEAASDGADTKLTEFLKSRPANDAKGKDDGEARP